MSSISKKSSQRSAGEKARLKDNLTPNIDLKDVSKEFMKISDTFFENQHSLNGSNNMLLREDDYGTGHGMRNISKSAKPTVIEPRLTMEQNNSGKNTKIMPYQAMDSQGSLGDELNNNINSKLLNFELIHTTFYRIISKIDWFITAEYEQCKSLKEIKICQIWSNQQDSKRCGLRGCPNLK